MDNKAFDNGAAAQDEIQVVPENGHSNGGVKRDSSRSRTNSILSELNGGDSLVNPNYKHSDNDKPEEATVHMKRQITLVGGVAMIVGTMIGSGIFVSPGNLMKRTDSVSWSLIMWFLCGVLAILTSLSYIELGVLVPKSGGEHAYFQEAYKPLHRYFGELPAFMFSWIVVTLLKPSSQAINCLAFGQYTLEPIIYYAGIDENWSKEGDLSYEYCKKILAIACAWGIAYLNIRSVKWAERVQIAFTVCKVSAIAIVIGIGVYNFIKFGKGSIPTEFDQGNAKISDFAIAAYSGLWAYDGWNNLNLLTEELINPARNLPLAIVFGIPFVMICYILINLSYLTVLTREQIIDSGAVAVAAGDTTLGVMRWIIPLLVALSTIGTANGSQFTAGRIGYVASRDGHLPSVISYVHAIHLSPTIAIMVNTILAMVLIFASSINSLIDFFGFVSWIFYALALAAVITLRYTQPDKPRKIKIPLPVPIIALLVSIFLVVAPVVEQPAQEYLYVLAFFIMGVILYTVFVFKQVKVPLLDKLTKHIQLITYVAPSPYKSE